MRVSRLTVVPVKGLRAEHPASVVVTPTGIVGDRQFFLVDADGKLFSASRTGAFLGARASWSPGFLDVSGVRAPIELGPAVEADFYGLKHVAAHEVLGPWSAYFTERAGQPVRLVHADEPNGGCDVHALTLLGEASVGELASRAGVAPVDSRRFRMSVEFAGGAPHAEDGWAGAEFRAGSVVLRVGGPVPRCAATTRDPDGGATDLKTLHLIKGYRGVTVGELGRGIHFGVYADVVEPGEIRVGDELAPA
ncbi:putative Fe-S protein [Cryptosporangium arvum DSM 44712]|uniref:Putative Fe-S protein n=1 Tax=Cryptosporangium arvum DSM 44712 TaxID=927661 RepID=A0A010Z2F0_9ACTN|nr:putative Fe-S protein [Cryptosporangium arvum DSM 44712]